MSHYIRCKTLTLEEAFKYIGRRKKHTFGEKRVGTKSNRLKCFKFHGVVCKHCGAVGVFFAIEKARDASDCWHLNLYAYNANNEEVLMTADHVIPRSRGGCNELENLQTLCTDCNFKKDNKLEEECCGPNLNIIIKK